MNLVIAGKTRPSGKLKWEIFQKKEEWKLKKMKMEIFKFFLSKSFLIMEIFFFQIFIEKLNIKV